MVADCGTEPEEQCMEQSVGTIAVAREKGSGAGGGFQGSGCLVWLSFVSIPELMLFGDVASYVVSVNVHINMLFAVLVHVQVWLHLLLACFD
jgi:hypothetical protein